MKTQTLIFLALLFLVVSTKAQQPTTAQTTKPYKYVIKGGRVVDPKNNIDAIMDVAVGYPTSPTARDGKIAAVARNIDPNLGAQVIDANGLYVVPGLIDLHVHVFNGHDPEGAYRNGPNGIPPDGFALRTGVTTVVDAGSSGWRNFETFKAQTIDRSKTRVLAMLNIVGEGMAGGRYEGRLEDMEVAPTVAMMKKYPQLIVGVKNAHFGGGNSPYYPANAHIIPVKLGVEAAAGGGGVFMLDGRITPEVFDIFRPGDIFTHNYGKTTLVDSTGKVIPFIAAARQKGIIFDTGNGGSSFDWPIAVPALKAKFWPNTISTDQHINSMNSFTKDMNNIMGMLIAFGMPFNEVIKASTWAPAQVIKRPELGHLSVGAVADICIFNLRDGKFGFFGANQGDYIAGTKRLENEITIRGGNIEYNLNGRIKPIALPQAAGGGGRGGRGGAAPAGGGTAPAGGRDGSAPAPASPQAPR